MKKIYNLNKIALFLTLFLYLTLLLGLYAQIVLGVIQIICALILFFYWKRFTNKTKEQLTIYWVLVIIYSICWLFDWNRFDDDYIFIIGIILIPMSIAIYFVYLLRETKKYIS